MIFLKVERMNLKNRIERGGKKKLEIQNIKYKIEHLRDKKDLEILATELC